MMRFYLLVSLVSGARIDLKSVATLDVADEEHAKVQSIEKDGVEVDIESEWTRCPTGRVKTAFNRGCAIVLSDNGRGRCRLQFEDGRTDEMAAMHLEHHPSCPQHPFRAQNGFVGQQGHGIYNPPGVGTGHSGHGIYNPNGVIVGQNGHGIYNPNGVATGRNGHGIYNPNGVYSPNGVFPGQNGGGIYNPNGIGAYNPNGIGAYNPNGVAPGQNGGGIYNPNGIAPGQNGGGIYNPNGIGAYNPNGVAPGQNGGGIYNPNGIASRQNGGGIYNPNGIAPGQNGGGIYNPNGIAPGQNGGGIYNPNGIAPGQNGRGIYNPNGAAPGQNGGGIYNPNAPGQNGGGTYNPSGSAPGRNGGGIYNPNGISQEQQYGQDDLWPQFGAENTRCTRGTTVRVGSRRECQARALLEHHPFYHYREDNNKCDTSMTCGSPLTGTRGPWRVYALPMWPQYGEENTRCARGEEVDVRNLVECQERAVSLGHAFYHFRWVSERRMDAGKCGTAETCNDPIVGRSQTSYRWRSYSNTGPSDVGFQGSR